MNHVHLGQLDLNLLRVFDALAEEGSATRAGARLGLSQSAVSHALARLRQLFGDPLFTRSLDGMRPTARAAEIAPGLREALGQLQMAIAPVHFSAERTDRRFVIAAGAYVASVFLPVVVEKLRQQAPSAEIQIRSVGSDLEESLRNGVDIGIGVFTEVSDRLARETLFNEEGVWVVRNGHPVTKGEITAERLGAIEQVALRPAGGDRNPLDLGAGRSRRLNPLESVSALDRALAQAGVQPTIPVGVHDIYGAMAIVARTDMMVLAPRRQAELHAQVLGLTLLTPFASVTSRAVECVWVREAGVRPALQWLRQVVREAAAEL